MKYGVSCIIVNFNDSIRTLSLLNLIKDYESLDYLIVVDNCSTDNSFDNLSKFNNPKYHLIKASHNGGYGFGNNVGALKAKSLGSKYILIANPDVLFDDVCVKNLHTIITQNPYCGVVGAKETHLGVSGWKYTSALHDVLSASLFFNKLLKKRYYPQDYFTGKGYVKVDLVPGCLLLVDLGKFIQVGMYDESIFLYEEEKILYKKMIECGFVSLVDLDSSYKHMHKESHSVDICSIIRGKKRLLSSRVKFLKKYRHLNTVQMFFSKIFFLGTILEMFVYGLFLNLKKRT